MSEDWRAFKPRAVDPCFNTNFAAGAADARRKAAHGGSAILTDG